MGPLSDKSGPEYAREWLGALVDLYAHDGTDDELYELQVMFHDMKERCARLLLDRL